MNDPEFKRRLFNAVLGVLPYRLWAEMHPDPTVSELLARYTEVAAAVERYREAGLAPDRLWRRELGLIEYTKRG